MSTKIYRFKTITEQSKIKKASIKIAVKFTWRT